MALQQVMQDYGLKTLNQAQTFVRLREDPAILEEGINFLEIKKAVLNTNSHEKAKNYLLCKCVVCQCSHTKDQMELIPLCNCEVGKECFVHWISTLISSNKHVNQWFCPVCKGQAKNTDKLRKHLFFIQMIVEKREELKDIRTSVVRKIAAWTMEVKHRNFRWCASEGCNNGFVYEGLEKKMRCPACRKCTCFDCRNEWTSDHDGKSCEEFQKIRFEKNPSHAELYSISFACPECNERFVLDPGGCMDMACDKCNYRFCLACFQQVFLTSKECKLCTDGRDLGLHAHHPRNCPFYTRDMKVEQLQRLLRSQNVSFESEEEFKACLCSESDSRDCGIKGGDYTEYLGGLVAENGLDPILVLAIEDISNICKRERIAIPPRCGRDDLIRALHNEKPIQQLFYVFTQLVKKEIKERKN